MCKYAAFVESWDPGILATWLHWGVCPYIYIYFFFFGEGGGGRGGGLRFRVYIYIYIEIFHVHLHVPCSFSFGYCLCLTPIFLSLEPLDELAWASKACQHPQNPLWQQALRLQGPLG